MVYDYLAFMPFSLTHGIFGYVERDIRVNGVVLFIENTCFRNSFIFRFSLEVPYIISEKAYKPLLHYHASSMYILSTGQIVNIIIALPRAWSIFFHKYLYYIIMHAAYSFNGSLQSVSSNLIFKIASYIYIY